MKKRPIIIIFITLQSLWFSGCKEGERTSIDKGKPIIICIDWNSNVHRNLKAVPLDRLEIERINEDGSITFGTKKITVWYYPDIASIFANGGIVTDEPFLGALGYPVVPNVYFVKYLQEGEGEGCNNVFKLIDGDGEGWRQSDTWGWYSPEFIAGSYNHLNIPIYTYQIRDMIHWDSDAALGSLSLGKDDWGSFYRVVAMTCAHECAHAIIGRFAHDYSATTRCTMASRELALRSVIRNVIERGRNSEWDSEHREALRKNLGYE